MKYEKLLAALALSFLLGVHDGYIALWKDGNPEPAEVFPYKAELLPETDRKRLEAGIRINSKQDLLELMEDYLS